MHQRRFGVYSGVLWCPGGGQRLVMAGKIKYGGCTAERVNDAEIVHKLRVVICG